ncbi:MAG: hypothetical protein LBP58_08880 [Azoarcus sp.]|jgi:Ca2+-binding RTX toxin-like protein|nr:hypothetical protein [Azoarcus sp.]
MALSLLAVGKSLLNLVNPLHYVNLVVQTPTLVISTIQNIAQTAHEVKYQSPVEAIKNITGTVTDTIGAIATAVVPGAVGELVATAADVIGDTVGNVAQAVTEAPTIAAAIGGATTAIISGAVQPLVSAVLPTFISTPINAIAHTVEASIVGISDFVGSFGNSTAPLVLSTDGFLPGILVGRDGADTITGGDKSDLLLGQGGADYIDGGVGNDKILAGGGNDTVIGGFGNDELHGSAGNDVLYGGAGKDNLYGEADDDILVGGEESDKLFGGLGDDQLDGGTGNDLLNGGAGNDYYVLRADSGDDTIYEEGGDADVLFFSGLGLADLVSADRSGNNLVINYAATDTDSNDLTIVDYFTNNTQKVEFVAFDTNKDGTIDASYELGDLVANWGL